MPKRILPVTFLLLTSIYFLVMAGPGLRTTLNSDDIVNLNVYVFQPASEIVKDNLLYFSSAYRPAGALFYRPLFDRFGFSPLPYRLVCFALLIVNLWLICFAILALTGSMEIAATATLIGAFHPRFRDLYTSSGTIYDILCFAFYAGAWLYYLHARRAGPIRRMHHFAILLLLYICALNAKEMAVTLPALFILTELFDAKSVCVGAIWRSCRLAIVAGIATVPYLWGKLGSHSPFHNLSTYRQEFGIVSFLGNCGAYLDALLYRDGIVRSHCFGPLQMAVLLGVMLGVGLLLRSRPLLFSWSMIMISFLPIAFIAPREPYAFYIPFVFWTLYAASLLVALRDRISARPVPFAGIDLRQIGLVILVFLLLLRAHRIERWRMGGSTEFGQPRIAYIVTALDRGHPLVPRGSTVLAVNDPYPTGEFGLILLMRLYFRDGTLAVDHADEDSCRYPHVIAWCGKSVAMIQHAEPCQVVLCDPSHGVGAR